WCPSPTGAPVDPKVAEAAENTLRKLADRGVRVEAREGHLKDAPRDALVVLFRAGSLLEAGVNGGAGFRRKRGQMSPTFAEFIEPALKLTLRDYLGAEVAVTDFLEQSAADFFKGYDLLASPTIATAPFDKGLPLGPKGVGGKAIDPHLGWLFTWPFNLTGQPAVSIPCGWTADR